MFNLLVWAGNLFVVATSIEQMTSVITQLSRVLEMAGLQLKTADCKMLPGAGIGDFPNQVEIP
eukprot:6477584-Pyramimonas_sp.AAC.1